MPSGRRRSASRGAKKRLARSASAMPRATSSRAVSGRTPIAAARAPARDSSIEGARQAIALTRPRYHRSLWITHAPTIFPPALAEWSARSGLGDRFVVAGALLAAPCPPLVLALRGHVLVV